MKALNDHVILKYDKKEDQKTGIIASDVSREKSAVATVIAIGEEITTLKTGDIVAFDPHVPRALKLDEGDFLVIKYKHIFAVI